MLYSAQEFSKTLKKYAYLSVFKTQQKQKYCQWIQRLILHSKLKASNSERIKKMKHTIKCTAIVSKRVHRMIDMFLLMHQNHIMNEKIMIESTDARLVNTLGIMQCFTRMNEPELLGMFCICYKYILKKCETI